MFLPQAVRDTFPENWPNDLKKLSFRSAEIEIDPLDVQMLGTFNGFVSQNTQSPMVASFTDAFYENIQTALAGFPGGVMPRIGYCSWKGSTLVHRPAKTLADVMQIVTQNDPRIGRALTCAIVAGEGVTLHLRAWQTIPDCAQFRVFIKNGDVIGVSQYLHKMRYPELQGRADEITELLQTFFVTMLKGLHINTVVADVWIDWEADPEAPKVQLIELNPFDPATGACLFNWAKNDFDGSVRYL